MRTIRWEGRHEILEQLLVPFIVLADELQRRQSRYKEALEPGERSYGDMPDRPAYALDVG